MFSLSILFFQGAKKAAGDDEAKQNFIDIILAGGPISIAIFSILLLLSIMAVYIFIERWLTIKRAGKVDQTFLRQDMVLRNLGVNSIRILQVTQNLRSEQNLKNTLICRGL